MSSVTKRKDFWREIFPSEAPHRDLLGISCAEKGFYRAAGTAKEPVAASAVNESGDFDGCVFYELFTSILKKYIQLCTVYNIYIYIW